MIKLVQKFLICLIMTIGVAGFAANSHAATDAKTTNDSSVSSVSQPKQETNNQVQQTKQNKMSAEQIKNILEANKNIIPLHKKIYNKIYPYVPQGIMVIAFIVSGLLGLFFIMGIAKGTTRSLPILKYVLGLIGLLLPILPLIHPALSFLLVVITPIAGLILLIGLFSQPLTGIALACMVSGLTYYAVGHIIQTKRDQKSNVPQPQRGNKMSSFGIVAIIVLSILSIMLIGWLAGGLGGA